ncbi:MAG: hypothetical protein JNN11_00675 [Candidatus Doudnabacteria bacterium]|nr:hypothetical protein [Candidatus Doudnabacteria bacterium]
MVRNKGYIAITYILGPKSGQKNHKEREMPVRDMSEPGVAWCQSVLCDGPRKSVDGKCEDCHKPLFVSTQPPVKSPLRYTLQATGK